MIHLNSTNVRDYLLSNGLIKDQDKVYIKNLGGRLSNVVLRVRGAGPRFVVKQAFSDVGKDPGAIERLHTEASCMWFLNHVLGLGVVPAVWLEDKQNHVFVMEAAPRNSLSWKKLLKGGEVDPKIGVRVGEALAQIHRKTRGSRYAASALASNKVFIHLNVEPHHRSITKRHPDVAPAVESEIDRLLGTKAALVHGDYGPANIMVKDDQIMILDFEAAHYGDPAYDPAFCLSHILLRLLVSKEKREKYVELALSFWDAYRRSADFEGMPELTKHVVVELGCLLLARIDGDLPVDYINDEAPKNAVREISKSIILRPTTDLQRVVEMVEQGSKHLS